MGVRAAPTKTVLHPDALFDQLSWKKVRSERMPPG